MPRPIPITEPSIPQHIEALKQLPSPGGVIDAVSSTSESLYHQTIHEKPIVFGYVSRLPNSIAAKDNLLMYYIGENMFQELAVNYGIRYAVVSPDTHLPTNQTVRLQYPDTYANIYSFESSEATYNVTGRHLRPWTTFMIAESDI